jgi:hypothetical protein
MRPFPRCRGSEVFQADLLKVAMPSLCDSTDFGLPNKVLNQSILKGLLGQDRETLSLVGDQDHEFFMVGDWNSSFKLVLWDKRRNLITYFVQVEVGTDFLPDKELATQVKVWSSITDPLTKGLPEKVFFDLILPRFDALLSDCMQTEAGMNFWKTRLRDADMRGFQVGLLNTEIHAVEWKPKDASLADWLDARSSAWGIGKREWRFVISKVRP